MIVFTATMLPGGLHSGAYEVMHGTATNQGTTPAGDAYAVRVVTRPNPSLGIVGFESDVEVLDSNRHHGLGRLLAYAFHELNPELAGVEGPRARILNRRALLDAVDFENHIRGGR